MTDSAWQIAQSNTWVYPGEYLVKYLWFLGHFRLKYCDYTGFLGQNLAEFINLISVLDSGILVKSPIDRVG